MAPSPAVHIIDDDDAVRDSLAILLEAQGFAVESYASAEAFLAHRADGLCGCVVTDVQMAGTDGLELLAVLSASAPPRLPVVVVTGRADEAMAARARAHGAIAFLEKPFTAAALAEAVRTAFSQAD
jgi:two-component system response regulator FixJ